MQFLDYYIIGGFYSSGTPPLFFTHKHSLWIARFIQELRIVTESDWNVPPGGRVYDERQEIRDYDHIIDHYDYKYYDNGDGTFDEKKVPVYKDVPIYDTKYYYKIDRWCYDRSENSSGKTDEPYWPKFHLGPKEKESGRYETYTIYFETEEKKTYTKNVSYEEWKKYNLGEKYHITVVAGIVTKIEP